MLYSSNMNCKEIYDQEFSASLNTLKHFREVWLNSRKIGTTDLFNYADDEFYFYRFAVSREEQATVPLMQNILYRVMAEYHLDFEIPDNVRFAPFNFIINYDGKRLGFTLTDFSEDEDINQLLNIYNLNHAFLIVLAKPNCSERIISRNNSNYEKSNTNFREMLLRDFFNDYISLEEYNVFSKHLEKYVADVRELTGYSPIKLLSSMNLSSQKLIEQKELLQWPYESSKYQVLRKEDEKSKGYLYLESFDLCNYNQELQDNYLSNGRYQTLIGNNDYAESFLTSEWLFKSFEGKKNFDYTSIVSGYLKSIEQLLYKIVMMNIDNHCYISIDKSTATINLIKKRNIPTYKINKNNKVSSVSIDSTPKYVYIDFVSGSEELMDSSIGTFEHFLRKNPHIFINEELAKPVADMVCCFRQECRNGFFHTHNLHDWTIVRKTRENVIFLYYLLLGACLPVETNPSQLGIIEENSFDLLCKKIRDFRHYSTNFIFEYTDGSCEKLIYDFFINNTVEYSEMGVEHY